MDAELGRVSDSGTPMRLEHVAIWVRDLEAAKTFYETALGGTAGARYRNDRTGFESYFLRFEGGSRLELMTRAGLGDRVDGAERLGLAHLAFTVGDDARVNALTEQLAAAGVRVVSPPRRTGDGYYESVVLDPEGNRIELVAS
jgi:lactoylglutathione lyase